MRKWLCCLLLLLPAWALAAPDTPYDPALMLHYPRLTAAQQQVFDTAYAAAASGQVQVPIDADYGDASAAMNALLRDCPELCALSPTYTLHYYQDAPHRATAIGLSYTMPLSSQSVLLQAASGLAARAQGDAFAREEFLHNALCAKVTYDASGANAHNAYGALAEGRAVCDGYANAMALLLRLSGIPCGVVEGEMNARPHAWNLVQVDGAYTWLDATNDDQGEVLTHFFFNLTDELLAAAYTLTTPGMPACTDMSVNWHVRRGVYVSGEAPAWPQGAASLELRFASHEVFLSLLDSLGTWLAQAGIQGQYSACYDQGQQCLLVLLDQAPFSPCFQAEPGI